MMFYKEIKMNKTKQYNDNSFSTTKNFVYF